MVRSLRAARRVARRSRCGRTCSPTPTSSPATSSTGPAASGVRRPRSCGRARSTRSRRVLRSARRRASPSFPRVATPVSSADRCRCTARSCSTCAGSTRSGRSTPRRPGHRGGRRHDRSPPGTRARGRAGSTASTSARATSRPSAARSRPTPAACTCCATARPAVRSSASRPCFADGSCHRPPRRAREGQHRLRPRRSAVRERGHAGGRHRGPAPARSPPARTWSSRCSRSTTSTPRSTRSGRCGESSTALRALELFFEQRGLDLVCDACSSPPPFPARPRRVRARRGGGEHRPDRRACRAPSIGIARVRDVAVATDARGRDRSGATARRTPRRSTCSARRTSST